MLWYSSYRSKVKNYISPTVVLVPTRADDTIISRLDPEARSRNSLDDTSTVTEQLTPLVSKLTTYIQVTLSTYHTLSRSDLLQNSITKRLKTSLSTSGLELMMDHVSHIPYQETWSPPKGLIMKKALLVDKDSYSDYQAGLTLKAGLL